MNGQVHNALKMELQIQLKNKHIFKIQMCSQQEAAAGAVPVCIALIALSAAAFTRMVMSTAVLIRVALTALSMPVVMWLVTCSGFAALSINL